jgi:hypothetical protein
MKSLSLTTFILFLFCLCLRGYSYYTYSKIKSKVTNTESIVNTNKVQSIALLNTLNDLSAPKVVRTIASEEAYKSIKPSLEVTFINDFYEPVNNLFQLEALQEKMREDNFKLKKENNSLEFLPIKLIYYLVIKENYDLSELKDSIKGNLYGFDEEELERIKEISNRPDFMTEILSFKNIPQDEIDSEIEQQATLAKLEKANIEFSKKLNEEEETEEDPNEYLSQLPEEVQEQIYLAENEEVDLEEKLSEMNYTEQEIEEIIEGYQN